MICYDMLSDMLIALEALEALANAFASDLPSCSEVGSQSTTSVTRVAATRDWTCQFFVTSSIQHLSYVTVLAMTDNL